MPTLYEVLDAIRKRDEKRAKDFQIAGEKIASALSDDSVIVVGNRTVCKINERTL